MSQHSPVVSTTNMWTRATVHRTAGLDLIECIDLNECIDLIEWIPMHCTAHCILHTVELSCHRWLTRRKLSKNVWRLVMLRESRWLPLSRSFSKEPWLVTASGSNGLLVATCSCRSKAAVVETIPQLQESQEGSQTRFWLTVCWKLFVFGWYIHPNLICLWLTETDVWFDSMFNVDIYVL